MISDKIWNLLRALGIGLFAAGVAASAFAWPATWTGGMGPKGYYKTFPLSDNSDLTIHTMTGNVIYRSTDLSVAGKAGQTWW